MNEVEDNNTNIGIEENNTNIGIEDIKILGKEEVKQIEDKRELKDIELDKLTVSSKNVRTINVEKDIEILAASMKKYGLRQPIEVRRVGDSDFYEVIAGSRRTLAARSLEWKTIRGFVVTEPPKEDRILSLSENINRLDIDPKDRATNILELLDEQGGDWMTLSEMLNRSVATLQHWASYGNVPEKIQEMVTDKKLGQGYARELARFSEVDPTEMIKIAEKLASVEEKGHKDAIINSIRKKPKITADEIGKKFEETQEELSVNIIFNPRLSKAIKEESEKRSEEPFQFIKSIIRDYLDGKGLL